jgi:hypothetical protein
MKDVAMLSLFVVLILGILAMAVYLIINNHPWWAILFALMAMGCSYRSGKP